jgi:hypothetical protein
VQDLKELVERIEPTPESRGDWDAVVWKARRRRRPVLFGSLAGVATVAVALFALVLFEPWGAESRTFLERALAAVDDGPVIHAVLRHGEGGTNVDLQTGERMRVHGETEIWYDPKRKVIRVVSRLGDTITSDHVSEQEHASRELIALARDYRTALESGSARIAGEDVLDGEKVTWVVVVAEMLPHAGGPLREWTQQVAVSQDTFKPVATRDAIGGKPAAHTLQRVLELESLPASEVDLVVPKERVEETGFHAGHEPIAVDRAPEVLGRPPLWLGQDHAALPLRQASKTWLRRGSYKAVLLEGQAAEDAKACRLGPGGRSRIEETNPACERHRARVREGRGGLRIQGNSVYAYERVDWSEKHFGVSFTYGDEKDVFVPLTSSTEPYVHLSEATDRAALLQGAAYFPPPGVVSLSFGGRSGSLVIDGLYVVIHASSPELVLSAARALEPMPG